ncbi:unnamed protein product, partial [Brenthis ino]
MESRTLLGNFEHYANESLATLKLSKAFKDKVMFHDVHKRPSDASFRFQKILLATIRRQRKLYKQKKNVLIWTRDPAHVINISTIIMSSRLIPATAANLIETSQLRRRYYSAQVYAQTQRALSIPVTLILRWDDHSTRPVRVKAQDPGVYVLSEG